MNSSKQIKLGALLSYFTIAFNILAGLIYTPWMISKIGQSDFGLYTLANSVISLFVMDFGMSAAVSRFASQYTARGEQDKLNNFLGLVYKLYLAIDTVVFIALIVVWFLLDGIYANLTPDELSKFKILYVIVGLFSIISFPFTPLNGVLTAYEHFVGMKLCDLFHKIIIIILMIAALLMSYGVYALVTVNAIAGLLTIAVKLMILHDTCSIKVNFKYWDKQLLKQIFGFSVWTTAAMLAQRLIFNITPTIIAAVSVTGAIGVALFGMSQTIEGYVFTLANAINGMFMPRVSRIIYDGRKDEELMPLMVKIGRLQCMIIGLLVTGFICFGKSFIIDIWRKPDFVSSYYGTVLLIIPSFFFLPMQIANTTLIVENKVKLQAIVFVIMGILNVLLSLVLSHFWGAFGACLSIFTAYMVRNILLVVIHQKVLHLNMWEFFQKTYCKLSPYLILAMILGFLLEWLNPISNCYIRFMVNGSLFTVAFFVVMHLWGFNKYEKGLLYGTIRQICKKRG